MPFDARHDWFSTSGSKAVFVIRLIDPNNVVMSLDWLYATQLAASNELVTFAMGGNWYIISYYVPVLAVVQHVMILHRLVKGRAT